MSAEDDWDGRSERRSMSPQAIAEQLVPLVGPHNGKTGPGPTAMIVIGVATLVLQVAGLLQHVLLAGSIHREAERQQEFRRTVSCFLYEVTRPDDAAGDRADVLARCGLIGVAPREVP